MATNTKKQNNQTKKKNKKNNKGSPKDAKPPPKDKSKPKSNKQSKPAKPAGIKLGPMPKTKLKPKYKKKCSKDISCIYGKDSFKPKIDDIYHNLDQFGFMIDIPNETPHSNKNFKVKCKGLKTPKIYNEPVLNKKTFGFLLPKLNSSLYVPKQQNHNCYETKNEIKRKDLPLGKRCYKDQECESKTCSNIKFLKFPGKCVLPKNTDKIIEGQVCNYEKDCKKDLTCVDKKCVKKPKTVLNTLSLSKKKKKNKKNATKKKISSYTPSFLRKRVGRILKPSNSNSNSNSDQENLKESELEKFKDNEDYYFNDSGEISKLSCEEDSFCKSKNKDGYCYKNKCVTIHKRCKVFENETCLKGISRVEDCCDEKSNCIDEGLNEICVNRSGLPKSNVGQGCFKDKQCKSGKCSNVKLCEIKKSKKEGYDNIIPCKYSTDCVSHKFGSKQLVCINNVCQKKNELKDGSLNIFDECERNEQCITKNCGKGDKTKPKPSYMLFRDSNICLGSGKETYNQLVKSRKKITENEKETSRKMKENFDNLLKKLDNELLFIHAEISEDSLVIIKKNDKLFLGTILEDVYYNKNEKKKIKDKVIIYFEKDTLIDDFSKDYENLMVICSSEDSIYYKYFSAKNKKNVQIKNIKENSLNLYNNFIFSYLCFILFGNRNILFESGLYFDEDKENYYNYHDRMIDINIEFEKNRFVGIKDSSIGLFHRMSIPFRYFENKIRSVFIEYNSNKEKIRDFFSNKLIQAKYYKNSETDILSYIKPYKFEFVTTNNGIKLKNIYKKFYENLKKKNNIIGYSQNITNSSIFTDVF